MVRIPVLAQAGPRLPFMHLFTAVLSSTPTSRRLCVCLRRASGQARSNSARLNPSDERSTKPSYSALHVGPEGVIRAPLNPPFAPLRNLTIGFEDDEDESSDAPQGSSDGDEIRRSQTTARRPKQAPRGAPRGRTKTNPATNKGPRGSNVLILAERAGFEPATHLAARTRFPVALLRPLGHLSASLDRSPVSASRETRTHTAGARVR